jgi:threonine dehydratase
VGGGGLMAGTAIAVRSLSPHTRILGAEPEAVDDAHRSMISGVRQPGETDPQTLADGLMTGLGKINFEILREREVQVITVTEEEIVQAARFILERMKLVVEPSGATVLAVVRRLGDELKGRRVGAIFTGGNTDFAWLSREAT